MKQTFFRHADLNKARASVLIRCQCRKRARFSREMSPALPLRPLFALRLEERVDVRLGDGRTAFGVRSEEALEALAAHTMHTRCTSSLGQLNYPKRFEAENVSRT